MEARRETLLLPVNPPDARAGALDKQTVRGLNQEMRVNESGQQRFADQRIEIPEPLRLAAGQAQSRPREKHTQDATEPLL